MADKHGKSLDKSYLLSVAGVIVLTLGSTIYLTIPDYFYFVEEEGHVIVFQSQRVDAAAERPKLAETEEIASPEVNETILVVDDETALLELAASHLENEGYSVICAGSGQEALQQLEANPAVDLLFTDIVMPGGMDGYELAETALRKHPKLKILLTSGFTKQAEQNQSNFSGSLPLSKPYTTAELSRRLRQLLHN